MQYCELSAALEAYRNGRNVTQVLRTLLGEVNNTSQIIEIAYDLQAGSYVEFARANQAHWDAYTTEIAKLLQPYLEGACTILDAGTGEMTTLAGVARHVYQQDGQYFACDISWSRLKAGEDFLQTVVEGGVLERIRPFVADIANLPLLDKSIDVVWTSHALEPNGGRERELLSELFRVARKAVILFEPSFEQNSREGQERMSRLGYIRGLPDTITELGGRLEGVVAMKAVGNPLNPTHAYFVLPPELSSKHTGADIQMPWACPATRLPLEARTGFQFCPGSKLAYPILDGIPILRPQAAILATRMQ